VRIGIEQTVTISNRTFGKIENETIRFDETASVCVTMIAMAMLTLFVVCWLPYTKKLVM